MKTKFLFILTMLAMTSLGAFAQSGNGEPLKGDLNNDGKVDAADVVTLVNIIAKGGEAGGDAKYYWYAGLTLPTASNIASIATGSSNSIEQWDGKEFTITNTTSSATPAYVCTPVDFKVSWKDTNGFTLNLVEVENSRFTLNGVEYKVQKRGRDLSAGASLTFMGYYDAASSETKYYWYAGPDMLTSETVPGTNADNECGYGWHIIEGNPTSIETGDLGSSDCEKINWVLAIPTKFGLNAISNGEDVTDAYDVSTVTTADGVEYMVFKQIAASKRTDRVFIKGNGGTSETKYYWYAGPDMLTSETVPGSGTVYPMTATSEDQIGWHQIDGTPSYIETGDLNYGEKINWVLAIPTKLGLNNISNGEIILDAYDISTVTCADGVEYMVFKQISASKKTSIYFVDGKTKYYLYFGTTLPTADNIASIANITEDVPEYGLFEDGHRWSLRNETSESADAYICIPSVYNVIWRDENGEAIDLIDVSTFTSGSIVYKVQKLKTPLGAGEKKYIYAYNSKAGDYYIYIGLNHPTADTNPESDLASNNSPLVAGAAAMGWRNIGPSIHQYSASNPAYNGSGDQQTVCLDKDFKSVTCYVVVPVGMRIYDGLGNIGGFTEEERYVEIKGHLYSVYSATLEGEFGNLIY